MTTVYAVALLVLAVVALPRMIRWRERRRSFNETFGFALVSRRHKDYAYVVRRVDSALHGLFFAVQECRERIAALTKESEQSCVAQELIRPELDIARRQQSNYERDFWKKFRAAEDCGVPLRYHVLDERFGVTLYFGRRDGIHATLGRHDAFREDLRAYDVESLNPDQAADTESRRLLRTKG